MFYLHKPSPDHIEKFRREQEKLELTYSEVGATFTTLPTGFQVDHTRVLLGRGSDVFEAAKAAFRRWDQFRLSWLEANPADTPLEVGRVIILSAKVVGFWWLNASRIIQTIDEDGPVCRFGFAYGTLPAHAGRGEERFLIEWNQKENTVSYDILAFSQSHFLVAKLAYPIFRLTQKKFGRESSAALRKIVTQ